MPEVELSTSFVGCTLYWKASGNQESIYLHQLYGLDEEDTWFDIGQTVESFYSFRPEEAGRAVKVRLVAIGSDTGTVAETEVAFEGQSCDNGDQHQAQKEFLLQNSTAGPTDGPASAPGPNPILIATSTILLMAFAITLVVVTVKNRKRLSALFARQRKLIADAQQHPVLNQGPNNQRISDYLRAVREETHKHEPIVGSAPGSHSLYV